MKELNLLILETCFLQKDLDQIFGEQDVNVPEEDKETEETVLKFNLTKSVFIDLCCYGKDAISVPRTRLGVRCTTTEFSLFCWLRPRVQLAKNCLSTMTGNGCLGKGNWEQDTHRVVVSMAQPCSF